jgi:Ras homolog gene family, member A
LGHTPRSNLASEKLPPYSLPKLRDLDQPFTFDISLYARPYRFLFYDTASPTNYTLIQPSFIILCYDIARRSTLYSLPGKWRRLVESHFNYDEALPVMVLGLKRDLRREWVDGEDREARSVMPQEGVRIAQEMRCDRYAECSAVTGELCREVLEDVARTAAKTTTEKGAKSAGTDCVIM